MKNKNEYRKETSALKISLLAIASLTSIGFLPLAQAADQAHENDSYSSQVQDTRWYIAPFGSFVRTGGDRNSSDGWGAYKCRFFHITSSTAQAPEVIVWGPGSFGHASGRPGLTGRSR